MASASRLDPQIAKLIPMLASTFEGERLNTLSAIERLLKNNKQDWHDLVKAMENPAAGFSLADLMGLGKNQADTLLDLAKAAKLFHTADGDGFADIIVDGHRETWPLKSHGFRKWLTRAYYVKTARAPSSAAWQSARGTIEANAEHDAPERAVHLRVGGLDGKIYLDLCDATWRAVEIDADGWRIISDPPIRFRRAAGMLALPVPVPGGTIKTLRPFLNVKTDDFVLAVAWALAVLRGSAPFPVLVLSGEHGSAKSTFTAIMRKLLDPNTAPLRALPRENRELLIAAGKAHILAFDNLSGLSPWISDSLCRLASGGGFAVRQLFTDQDEVLFNAARPVIVNGIDDLATRPDLADRAVVLALSPILENQRRSEHELTKEFERQRPAIIGALLDAVVHGLKRLPDTRLATMPRMADFALWATACEGGLWPSGAFMRAYTGNRLDAVDDLLDHNIVARTVRGFMAVRPEWKGTATELWTALETRLGKQRADWPTSAHSLSNSLKRVAPALRKVGIEISKGKEGHDRKRMIYITRTPENTAPQPSAPSAPSATTSKANPGNGFDASMQTSASDADDADDADARFPHDSNNGVRAAITTP